MRGLGFELLAGLEPVQDGHHEVEEDEVGRVGRLVEGLLAVVGRDDIDTLPLRDCTGADRRYPARRRRREFASSWQGLSGKRHFFPGLDGFVHCIDNPHALDGLIARWR